MGGNQCRARYHFVFFWEGVWVAGGHVSHTWKLIDGDGVATSGNWKRGGIQHVYDVYEDITISASHYG